MAKRRDGDKGREVHPVMRYSGMAFSMGATIGLGTFAGVKADERWGGERPVWTAVGALLGTLIAIYQVIQSLSR